MRINELLEGKIFNDLDFIKTNGDKTDIDYDLCEDLMHFMHNDDNVYRRHLYPVIAKCLNHVKHKSNPKADYFKSAVDECYQQYIKKFPIRQLPTTLDEKTLKEVCDKLCEEFKEHHEEGKYKD
jgi:hypothetical protein